MKMYMKKELIIDIIASLLILLFLYTGLNKIVDHEKFYTAVYKSPLLKPSAFVLSWLVPIGEIAITIALFIPRTRRLGLISSFITMAIFTIYVGFMLYFRSDRPCTCGGIIQQMTWHQHLYFNTGFALLALMGIWLDRKVRREKYSSLNAVSYAS